MTQLQILWNPALFLDNQKSIALISFPICSPNLKKYCTWISLSMFKGSMKPQFSIRRFWYFTISLLDIVSKMCSTFHYLRRRQNAKIPLDSGLTPVDSPVELHLRLTDTLMTIFWVWPFSSGFSSIFIHNLY